jgi:alkanesulfonate monooxygenase SsuD/methylene tetrahydromethanopterin reductase-like flavin-dependent oxidoreductase (luciferase family)
MTTEPTTIRSGPDIGLALSLSATALSGGLDRWIAPVAAGRFDSVWSLENPLDDQAEPLMWLAAAAVLAPRAGVGTAALIAPIRHPVLLARQLATLDHVASGGVSLGVTIGRRPSDYELTGTEFTRRGQILDDTIDALRAIWSDADLEVSNPSWQLRAQQPVGIKPRTSTGPAVLVGGHADVALRRAALRGDGYLAGATSGPAHALATQRRLLDLLDEHDRDPRVFRFVANLFVLVDSSPEAAIDRATEIFHRRHGGPPPYDPASVVAAGPVERVAATVEGLFAGGYSGVNLVPVAMTIDQVESAGDVARMVRAWSTETT